MLMIFIEQRDYTVMSNHHLKCKPVVKAGLLS